MLKFGRRFGAYSLRQWCGFGLLLVSAVTGIALLVVLVLPLAGASKLMWAGGLGLVSELTGWSAMPLLGPEVKALLQRSWQRARAWIGQLRLSNSRLWRRFR